MYGPCHQATILSPHDKVYVWWILFFPYHTLKLFTSPAHLIHDLTLFIHSKSKYQGFEASEAISFTTRRQSTPIRQCEPLPNDKYQELHQNVSATKTFYRKNKGSWWGTISSCLACWTRYSSASWTTNAVFLRPSSRNIHEYWLGLDVFPCLLELQL